MTKKIPRVSLIVSTYNRPDALNLCLQSIAKQAVLPDEVVVGDDGSGEETRRLIESFQQQFPVPIIHVWQEDKGFRLAKCRNKAVAACNCEYIIEIDGDLILHPRFVADHLAFAEEGCFLKGGRVNLTERRTNDCCRSGVLPTFHLFSRGLRRRPNALHSLLLGRFLSTRYKKNDVTGLGCNMSFWKEDYIRINGYDEFYEGWGGEDCDFAFRMSSSGIRRKYLKFSGIVYHLWHKDLYMQNRSKNFDYLSEQKRQHAIVCPNGVDKYL